MSHPISAEQGHSNDEPVIQHMTQVASGTYRLKRQNQILRVVSGTAWVTMDGEDYTLQPGQELRIMTGSFPAIVDVMSSQPLVFSEHNQ